MNSSNKTPAVSELQDLEGDRGSSMNQFFSPSRFTSPSIEFIMKKQINELRERIINYVILSDRTNDRLNYALLPKHADILLFGPAGSGKSSLIRTFFRALHQQVAYNEDMKENLIIKSKDENEGTTMYTPICIKQSMKIEKKIQKILFSPRAGSSTRDLIQHDVINKRSLSPREESKIKDNIPKHLHESSAITVHDTRGQIWMDRKEQKQLSQIIKGKIKDKTKVEQRNYRYAYLLWEFWKRDLDLFPKRIKNKKGSLKTKPHCLVFVFDGSMDEIPNGEEETQFYKDIIGMARQRHYYYPQVVLTCMDKVEEQIMEEELEKTGHKIDDFEKEQRLREIIELKIEKVVLSLGVNRSSVHFIENYKTDDEDQKIRIDYKALRLMHECLQQCDAYLLSQLHAKSKCSIF